MTCLSEDEVLAFAAGQLSPELREEAHRHLDACGECQQLLNEAVHALATSRTAGEAEPEQVTWNTTFRPGAVIGRYKIRRFIARGGMGEVYEAFDQELLERVALKTVTSTACDDPNAVRRLKAEVQLARRVSHPNVCRIYDFGTHRAAASPPLSFLTMEFVEGETLGVRLRRTGALPVAEATSLARALLRGLQAAHVAGVLHRDFKSDNVMLRRDYGQLEPLILDFGLARALDHSELQSSASGRGLVGTFAYIAPEQLEGGPYTTASDVYSLGLVWFEMLTGQLPFKARSSPALTTLDRLTKAVPAPSSLNPQVPSVIDAVVLACLRRSVRERLQTPAAVLARLEELEQRANVAPPKRKPVAVWAVAGVALGAGALGLLDATKQPPAAPLSVKTSSALTRERLKPTPLEPSPIRVDAAPSAVPASTRASSVAPKKNTTRAKPPLGEVPAAPSPPPPPTDASAIGWENPFASHVAAPTSAQLRAVLNQPLDRRTTPGNAEFPESGGQLVGDRTP